MEYSRMRRTISVIAAIVCCAVATSSAPAAPVSSAVDPTAVIAKPVLESSVHRDLPEQFIDVKAKAPWNLRRSFTLRSVPRAATLYVAARNSDQAIVRAYLNGVLVSDLQVDSPSGKMLVTATDVSRVLRAGTNEVALRAGGTTGIAVKLIPRSREIDGPEIVRSDSSWKANGAVSALGSIESYENLLGNADANMYLWPGYDGISPYLARVSLPPASVAPALDKPPGTRNSEVLVDFGRETVGRLKLTSRSDVPVRVALQYGESVGEALAGPYLGTQELSLPPRGTVYGPKSAFRYARLAFLSGTRSDLGSIQVEAIYYPVKYLGSFESSDPLLNRIWAIGAYTVHLCMQDTIWDAPKRDRLPWSGDLNVSGQVIDDVFADRFLMKKTLTAFVHDAGDPMKSDVNGIPGYSAFWVMNLSDYYLHTGDLSYVRAERGALVRLLVYMRGELGADDTFANTRKAWSYVDWSPDFDGDTPQARAATTFEFYRAFVAGAALLRAADDASDAQTYETLAQSLRGSAQKAWLDPQASAYVSRWQTAAMAIFSGTADATQTQALWNDVLSKPSPQVVTPYYNYYVISAMADADQRSAALKFIRTYWGGMLAEGATSFWEGYDPKWPKADFHRYLQADDGQGYYTSLSHGWAAGPTAWMMQQILGITPIEPGFSNVAIRPDLAGLAWVRGSEPTPHGDITMACRAGASGLSAEITLPAGVRADVSMPVRASNASILVNAKPVSGISAEAGRRRIVTLQGPGHYLITPGAT